MTHAQNPAEPHRLDEADEVVDERPPLVAVRRLVAVAVTARVERQDSIAARQRFGDRRPYPRGKPGGMVQHGWRAFTAEIEIVQPQAVHRHEAAGWSRERHGHPCLAAALRSGNRGLRWSRRAG